MEKLTFNHTGEILGKVDENGNVKLTDAGIKYYSKIIIPLTPRTKKNSQQIRKNHVTGQRFVAPSNTFLVYQNQCFPFLYQMRSNADALPYPLNIKCLFTCRQNAALIWLTCLKQLTIFWFTTKLFLMIARRISEGMTEAAYYTTRKTRERKYIFQHLTGTRL